MALALLKTHGIALSFSALLLHQLLLLPTAVAQRNDIFSTLTTGACACCDVSPTSRCCTDCLQGRAGTPGTGGGSSPLSRDGSESYTAAGFGKGGVHTEWNSQAGEWGQWQESDLRSCDCCSKVVGLSLPRAQRLLAQLCCILCQDLSLKKARSDNALALPRRLPVLHDDDVSSDVRKDLKKSPTKRMTSMDCMCCMNSGISDCCSKCRIF